MSRRRNPIPRALIGKPPAVIARFWADWDAATARERLLPRNERLFYAIGPSYASVGWLLAHEWMKHEESQQQRGDPYA